MISSHSVVFLWLPVFGWKLKKIYIKTKEIAEVLRIVWTQVDFKGIKKLTSKLKNPAKIRFFFSFLIKRNNRKIMGVNENVNAIKAICEWNYDPIVDYSYYNKREYFSLFANCDFIMILSNWSNKKEKCRERK